MIALIIPVLKIIAACTIAYFCVMTMAVGIKLLRPKVKLPVEYTSNMGFDFKTNTLTFTNRVSTDFIEKLLDKYN